MQRRRLASRILMISPSGRLLLFKIHYRTGVLAGVIYWATPGGKLREGESFEAAAVREVYEETGIEVDSVGNCITRKEFSWRMPDGERVQAIENYYVVHVHDEQCSTLRWSAQERDAICDVRWWSEHELAACYEDVYPSDLSLLFSQARPGVHPSLIFNPASR